MTGAEEGGGRLMTGARCCDKFAAMRAVLILFALAFAVPAAARDDCAPPMAMEGDDAPLVPIEPEAPVAPALLAPLADDSPWRARFEEAADALWLALRSGDPERWGPLLGGRWLGDRERQDVAALLGDRCAAFAPLLAAEDPVERRVFGWRIPAAYSPADRAEIAARPEAEALVCWAAQADRWPRDAAEADNRAGRPFACARIAWSVRDGAARWRAFIERR